ncbi:MAG: hypothetical protein EHM35_20650 [Planctomycetaceae bacterium]|nr:MAG: hypothetical protein EHM35_20650 [Planctomycetaceae bacterium]
MTRHELASFALKLLGIYAFIEALPLFQSLGGLVYALRSDRPQAATEAWVYVIMLIPLLLTAAAGAILLVFSQNLAPRLVGEDKPLGMSSVLTGRDVQAIGFAVVAVLIFLHAIPQIAQAVWTGYYAISQHVSEPTSGRMRQDFLRYGIPAVIQLVLAFILFLQARGLAGLWHRIRTGGQGQ